MGESAASCKVAARALGWGAAILGVLFGRYTGANLLIPLAGAAIAFYVLRKFAPSHKSAWFPAISIQTGHAIWFIVGLAILGQLNANALDPILLLLGSLWLLLRPGTLAVIVMSTLQLLALAYNVYIFAGTAFGTATNEALSVHIAFRVLAVGFMVFAWVRSRRSTPVAA
jgi:hypothetical protein